MAELVRLQRYLASAGVAARRKCEEMITAGRVKVNGAIVTVLGTKIDPDHDRVQVDDEAVAQLDTFYVLLNKPKACITAVSDDRGRPTVMDYLPNLPIPVKPVGRLDFYTEGVLLLTNDGELAARLLAPASHVPKTYHVKVHGQLHADDIKLLRDGIRLDDGMVTMPADIAVLPGESKHTWLAITIHEGKHRQIHRMIEALGYQVDKLQRVAFANLSFHNLRVGDARELSQQELNGLRDVVGLDHSAVARGRWRSDRETTDIPRRARAKARTEAEAAADAAAAGRTANGRASESPGEGIDEEDGLEGAPAAPARPGPGSAARSSRPDPRDSRGPRGRVGPPADYDRPAVRALRGRATRPEFRSSRGGEARADARGSDSRGGRGGSRPDSRGPRADSRGPRSDSRGPRADSRGPRADSRGPRADSRGPRADSRGPRSDSRGPRPDSRGPRSDTRAPRGARSAAGGGQPETRARGGGGRSGGRFGDVRGLGARTSRPTDRNGPRRDDRRGGQGRTFGTRDARTARDRELDDAKRGPVPRGPGRPSRPDAGSRSNERPGQKKSPRRGRG